MKCNGAYISNNKSAGCCKVSSHCCTSKRRSSANCAATVQEMSAYVTGELSLGMATSVELTSLVMKAAVVMSSLCGCGVLS